MVGPLPPSEPTTPFRRAFDAATTPYAARNALGILDTGGGGGGGNVSNSGTPTVGQYAKWVTATTIQGVAPATVLSDIGAQPAGSYQPLDADLTALAAASGTNTIYYRSAANTWSPVNVSTGLAFSGGNLTATGGGGTPGGSNTHVQYNNSSAFGGSANFVWNNGTNVLTVTGQISVAAGSATSVVASGVVEASSLKCTGTSALLSPASSGNVILRPAGPITTTGQVVISPTSVTMSSPVILPADPTTALQAATKQYVDAKAPLAAEYITSTADATLTAERVLTDTATVTWDRTTAGQIKANATGGGGGFATVTVQKFTASGTYTPTASMKFCTIEAIGGGGGGGGVGDSTAIGILAAGGGGSGGYSRLTASAATIGASQTVTIGAAGSAGTAGGGNGGNGGVTSVGTLCVANGGSGGVGTTTGVKGGAGGTTTGAAGDITAAGAPGGGGISVANFNASSGAGGSGFFGGGGLGANVASGSVVGTAASNYGSGGSGAYSIATTTTRAGGAGSTGFVIITEYA